MFHYNRLTTSHQREKYPQRGRKKVTRQEQLPAERIFHMPLTLCRHMDFSSYISRGFGFFFHPNRSNSALLIGSRYKSAVMWVRSGISKRRKRRGGGGGKRKGEMVVISSPTEKGRGLLLFVGMLRGISPWNSIGGF